MARRAAAAGLLSLLMLAGVAGAATRAPARASDDAATIRKAIKLEELAIDELTHGYVNQAIDTLNESRVLLADVAGHVSGPAESDLRQAEDFDVRAIEQTHQKDGLRHARSLVHVAIVEKQFAIRSLPHSKHTAGGLGCTGLLGESKAYPGETEVVIKSCTQDVSEIVLEFPKPLKSMSKSAVVSKKIGGGLATSPCAQPKPNEADCGGFPTFDPAGGTFLLDVLPHAKAGDKVTATIHGKTVTMTLTLVQH